jgi:uncharacterized protein
MFKIFKLIKFHINKVLELKTNPHNIALGFALGTFIALLPTFGLGALIGLFLLLIFENINKISLLSAFVVWNPLILAPIYYLSYKLGVLIYGGVIYSEFSFRFKDLLYTFSKTFLVGNFILSLVTSIFFYFLIKFILIKINSKKTLEK